MKNDKDVKIIKILFTITLMLFVFTIAFCIWYVFNSPKITNTNIQYVGQGKTGASAYEIAKINGFKGTEIDWVSSLKGKDGETKVVHENTTKVVELPSKPVKNGKDGKSAYELWIDSGNSGNISDFLLSLTPVVEPSVTQLRIKNGILETKTTLDRFWLKVPVCGEDVSC